ncbi:site-specific integrase [Vagococcus sp. PNs007]|uniref:Site-specific integrase n=1 Tax=Vagococcus proximus TaxID=2991417 RepID=A0ABT5X2N1_9ENTE|nr:tyrosine-type recombinase/integrase [Vagococcus proximus]MDF0480235.1 site-specific integrase [Vagococcus proximus]
MASYKKLETGWQYRISYYDVFGKRIQKAGNGYPTKKEAQIAATNLENKLYLNKNIDATKIVFSDFFMSWYKLYKEPFIALKTKENYLLTAKIVSSYFGKLEIQSITEEFYQKFINDYTYSNEKKKQLSKETVSKVNHHIKSCFKKAIKNGYITTNPADEVVIGGYVKNKHEMTNYLNEKDLTTLQKELIKSLNPKNVSSYILLLSTATGPRYSEVIGLTWNDIDFKNHTITINKSWDNTHSFSFGPTKNKASNRTITVDETTLSYIKQLKIRQKEKKLNFNNLVFSVNGSNPPSNNALNTSLTRALKRCQITNRITHHGLRHSHVSLLLYKGINIKYISRRVGHSDVSTTLNKYSHVIDEMTQLESSKINKIFNAMYT